MASELRRQHRDLYLVKERGLARQTARTYDYGIDVIERFSGKDISAIAQSTRHVRTYLAESSDPASTKRIVVAAVKSVARFRSIEYDEPPSPVLALSAPRVYPEPKLGLPRHEARRILLAAESPVEIRFAYLGLYAGLRRAEMEAVSEFDDVLVLRDEAKGGRPRVIPVHPQLHAVRDVILSKRPTYGALGYRCVKLSERLGLPFTLHDLRYTFAHLLEEVGVSFRVRKSLLGHDSDITIHYSPPSLRRKRDGIRRVDYGGEQLALF